MILISEHYNYQILPVLHYQQPVLHYRQHLRCRAQCPSAAIFGDPGHRSGVPGGDGGSAQLGDKPKGDEAGLGCDPKLLPVVYVYDVYMKG